MLYFPIVLLIEYSLRGRAARFVCSCGEALHSGLIEILSKHVAS